MQETEFIAQNKKKWKDLEFELEQDNKDPEKLLELFIQTTDDLSYSYTHYPNRSVRHYLNGFARSIHAKLYANRRRKKNAFIAFWQTELPQALYHARKQLTLSLCIMALGVLIGVVSCIFDDGFPAIVLSERYVQMTEELIAQGNPLGVYGLDDNPLHMFLSIAWNNIQYAFGAFVLGALYGIGTVYALLSTGIMVGAFTMFFVKKGLFSQMFFAVMLHGTLELGTIVIAGGAGLLLAKAIMFPGSYTRMESLVTAGRMGIRIMIAVAIFLFYAALIEGYLTRYTEASNWMRGGLILFSAMILIGYFVIYPLVLVRFGWIDSQPREEVSGSLHSTISLERVKSANEIIADALSLFFRNAGPLFRIAAGFSLLGVAALVLCNKGIIHYLFDFPSGSLQEFYVWRLYRPLYESNSYSYLLLAALILSGAIFFSSQRIHGIFQPKSMRLWGHVLLTSCAVGVLLTAAVQADAILRALLLFLLLPVALFIVIVSQRSNMFLFGAIARVFRLIFAQLGNFLLCQCIIVVLHYLILLFTQSAIVELVMYFVQINVPSSLYLAAEVPHMAFAFLVMFILVVIMQFTMLVLFLFYSSANEVNTAELLMRRIRNIGNRRNVYGVAQEDHA